VMEITSVNYMMWRENRALRDVEAGHLLADQEQPVEVGRQRLILAVIRYLSEMNVEYVTMVLAVFLAVTFAEDQVVVGFATDSCGLDTIAQILVPQFSVELIVDWICVAVIRSYGVDVLELFSRVQKRPFQCVLKMLICLCTTAPIVIPAFERQRACRLCDVLSDGMPPTNQSFPLGGSER